MPKVGGLEDANVERCVTAERVVVAALNGDCQSPIAALAEIQGDQMTLRAAVGARSGEPPVVRAQAVCPADQADAAVGAVLKSLSEQNVQALLTGGR